MKSKISEKSCQDFWQAAMAIIDEAGDYASRLKLRNNLRDSTTAWRVEKVLDKYYQGRLSVLEDKIVESRENYFAKIDKYNIFCRTNGLPIITKPEVFLDILLSTNKRKSYREKILRRMKKGVICPLQDFEK